MTKEQQQKAIELFLNGMSKSEIGRILGVERHTIGRLIKQKNIDNPNEIKPNQRYGKLITIEPTKERDTVGRIKWLCKCDCGNLTVVSSSLLKNGNTQSCGCLQKEATRNHSFIDLTGKRFGKLTVIKENGKNAHNDILWFCQCDCGNSITTTGSRLKQGQTKSCGCLQSVGEYKIEQLLLQYDINYIHQYSFNDLLSQKHWPLRFDFAIFKNNNIYCLIEYQGPQHYDINNPYHTNELEYNDAAKIRYCQEKGYTLIHINQINDIDNIIRKLVANIND